MRCTHRVGWHLYEKKNNLHMPSCLPDPTGGLQYTRERSSLLHGCEVANCVRELGAILSKKLLCFGIFISALLASQTERSCTRLQV
jgi:hypothetical protein